MSLTLHPIIPAQTPKIPSLPYHSPKTFSPSSGFMIFCTPQTSSPATHGGNCFPTTLTCAHCPERAFSVTRSAASCSGSTRFCGIREFTRTKPFSMYCNELAGITYTSGKREHERLCGSCQAEWEGRLLTSRARLSDTVHTRFYVKVRSIWWHSGRTRGAQGHQAD